MKWKQLSIFLKRISNLEKHVRNVIGRIAKPMVPHENFQDLKHFNEHAGVGRNLI